MSKMEDGHGDIPEVVVSERNSRCLEARARSVVSETGVCLGGGDGAGGGGDVGPAPFPPDRLSPDTDPVLQTGTCDRGPSPQARTGYLHLHSFVPRPPSQETYRLSFVGKNQLRAWSEWD